MTHEFDLVRISRALFDEKPRAKIINDFPEPDLAGAEVPEDFFRALLKVFDQNSADRPEKQKHSNNDVLRAAFQAIGSNMRKWKHFDQNPEKEAWWQTLVSVARNGNEQMRIAPFAFPGQTGRRDAKALVEWKHLLDEYSDYYSRLMLLARAYDEKANRLGIEPLSPGEQMICIAATIGDPKKSQQNEFAEITDHFPVAIWKTPGMRITLACEFLRNLRWPGFKPDRHVMRLLKGWAKALDGSDKREIGERSDTLIALVNGRRNKETGCAIRCSLLGLKLTPDDISPSHADNLVWALGAYVETKRRDSGESDHYLRDRAQ